MEAPTLEQRSYTRAQRLLLIAALILGLAWDFGWQRGELWPYGAFWGAYLVIFYLLNWKTLKRNCLCWTLAAAVALLCARFGWRQPEELTLMNLAGIPLILMTHAVFAVSDIPRQREGAAVGLALKGFFVKPFSAIPDAFRAFASLFTRKGTGGFKRVLLGLAIGLPLAAIVLLLLVSADEMMGRLLGGWFGSWRIGRLIGRILNVLICALLFYSFLFNSRWGKRAVVAPRERLNASPVTAQVVLVLLLLVYAVFAYVQFRYLFGGRLPVELTYSEYARKGFGELIAVALINFSAYTAINALCREGGALRVLQGLLLVATAILLASAMQRLMLYILAYGLTMLRILPLWLMLWLAVLDVLAAVRLFKPTMPLLRIAAILLIWWFAVLSMPDWAEIISVVNLRYF